MDKIYLRDLKKFSPFINQGTQAIVVHDRKYAYKLFKRNMRASYYYEQEFLKERLERLSRVKLDSYVTPKMTVNDYLENIVGYGMDYIKGDTLNKLDLRVNTSKFIDDLKRLEEDTYKLSEEGFELRDKNSKNIIYNREGFHVIDMDFAFWDEESETDIIITSNLIFLNDLILKALLNVDIHDVLTTYEYDLIDPLHNQKSLVELIEMLDNYNDKENSKLRDLRREKSRFRVCKSYYGRN